MTFQHSMRPPPADDPSHLDDVNRSRRAVIAVLALATAANVIVMVAAFGKAAAAIGGAA